MDINRKAAPAYIPVVILLIGKARCRAELQSHAANLRASLDQLQEMHVIGADERDAFEAEVSRAVQDRCMDLLPDHLRRGAA